MAGKDASEAKGSVRFERHRPEQTLLYRLVEKYYLDFEMQWASEGRVLPDYVRHGKAKATGHANGILYFSCFDNQSING